MTALSAALLLAGCGGGAPPRYPAAGTGSYSHVLHARFYEAWAQPDSVRAPRGRISVPVDVRIDPRGRVTSFELAKSSGYPAIDESIAEVGRRIRKVKRPPIRDGEFRLRVFFDLDVKR